MWANIVKAPSKPKKASAPVAYTVAVYGIAVGASWGDIAFYNEKEDGPYKEFLLESARKRAAVKEYDLRPRALQVEFDEEKQEQDAQDAQENQDQPDQPDQQDQQDQQEQARLDALCKCGCGRPAHKNPRPDFVGHCCGWCKKHNGKRGHGDGCGK